MGQLISRTFSGLTQEECNARCDKKFADGEESGKKEQSNTCKEEMDELQEGAKERVINELKEEYTDLVIELLKDDSFLDSFEEYVRGEITNDLSTDSFPENDELAQGIKMAVINELTDKIRRSKDRFKETFPSEESEIREKIDGAFLKVKEEIINADEASKKDIISKGIKDLTYKIFLSEEIKGIRDTASKLINNLRFRPDYCTSMCEVCDTTKIQEDYRSGTIKSLSYYIDKYKMACERCKPGYRLICTGGSCVCLKESEILDENGQEKPTETLPRSLLYKYDGFQNMDKDIYFTRSLIICLVICLLLLYFCK